MNDFTQRAIHILQGIPKGSVMTYGQVALLAGSPRGARQVVRILHSLSRKHNLPWHRVVNAKGEIGFRDDEHFNEQKLLLQMEGVEFSRGNRIRLEQYRHHPDIDPLW